MPTYKEIQSYVKTKHGFVPKTCWIAHMKEICGIEVKVSHNRYDINKRENPCPSEKMYAIKDAFTYFKMI